MKGGACQCGKNFTRQQTGDNAFRCVAKKAQSGAGTTTTKALQVDDKPDVVKQKAKDKTKAKAKANQETKSATAGGTLTCAKGKRPFRGRCLTPAQIKKLRKEN